VYDRSWARQGGRVGRAAAGRPDRDSGDRPGAETSLDATRPRSGVASPIAVPEAYAVILVPLDPRSEAGSVTWLAEEGAGTAAT
jgi:hypothetical protein